jgi:hypothetical protein
MSSKRCTAPLFTLAAPETLGGGVEVRRRRSKGILDPLAQLRREGLAARREVLEPQVEPPSQLLVREQARGRWIHGHELRVERVEARHELLDRLGHRERQQAV